MVTSEDPIRADVERCLHAVVGATMAAPGAVVGSARRCVSQRADTIRQRLFRPARLVKSLVDLAASSAPTGSGLAAADVHPPRAEVVSSGPPTAGQAPDGTSDASIELPIEEYESLAASQVVARLPSLTADELADVRRFESAHRGRRTVLGKIDQLLLVST